MKLTTDTSGTVSIVRIGEARLTYPVLPDLSAAVTALIDGGADRLVLDLTPVGYIDSATIGCLMDLYRSATEGGAVLKLSGVQDRVRTMLTLTGCHNFLDIHTDEGSAVSSF